MNRLPETSERRRLARLITRVERDPLELFQVLPRMLPEAEWRPKLGFTGPVGAGKSTLISALLSELSPEYGDLAAVSVDPTSPVSGGALLGDRIRALESDLPGNVYYRSLASRGSRGGVSASTAAVSRLLEACGFGAVLVETVGAGQTSLEIAGFTDLLVLVLSPEHGDVIQAMKSGLSDLADIFVVNKSDREGADRMYRALRSELEHRGLGAGAVLQCSATEGKGTEELAEALIERFRELRESDELRERRVARTGEELFAYLRGEFETLLESGELKHAGEQLGEALVNDETAFSEALQRARSELRELWDLLSG